MGERNLPTEVTCRIAAAIGRQERCPETLCPYWESAERRAPTSGCGLHEIAPYLRTQPKLARYLLALRPRLGDVPGT